MIRAVAVVFVVMLLAVPAYAHAALLDRVNEAIRVAGIPLTVHRSQAFQKGVVAGHYKTFDQLKGAIQWHFVRNTLPVFPAGITRCKTGPIITLSTNRMVIQVTAGGTGTAEQVLTLSQYNDLRAKGARPGIVAEICSTDSTTTSTSTVKFTVTVEVNVQ